jgi:hypothetical protein
MASLARRLIRGDRPHKLTAVALGTGAVAGAVFDLSPVDLGLLAATMGSLWFVHAEHRDDRLGDRTAHLTSGLLALSLFGYFGWVGDIDGTLVSSLLTFGAVSLGRAAWAEWSMGEAVEGSTHPFTPTASSDDPVAGEVRTTLSDGPRTRRELREAVDAEAEAVDDALTDLRERGVVTQAGSEFRLDG